MCLPLLAAACDFEHTIQPVTLYPFPTAIEDLTIIKIRITGMVMFALFTMLPACLVLQLYTTIGQYLHHTLFAVLR